MDNLDLILCINKEIIYIEIFVTMSDSHLQQRQKDIILFF